MTTVSDVMQLLWHPGRKDPQVRGKRLDRTLPENFKYYSHWGFTIYRTYYSPESDKYWDMLLDALKRQTHLAFGYLYDEHCYRDDIERYKWSSSCYKSQDEYNADLKRIEKLFSLDLREDQSLLDGLTIRQLRKVCLQEQPKVEQSMAGRMFGYVLVADEFVLKDIARGEFVVKALAYNWEEGDNYWGWMRIGTGYLLEFWHELTMMIDSPLQSSCFYGPEDDLETYIWPGDDSAYPFSNCSEIRRGLHYSAQRVSRPPQKPTKMKSPVFVPKDEDW